MNTPKFEESDAFTVLRQVENHTTQKSLADNIGYSVGKVNYILKALAVKGHVKLENFINNKNKKAYRYLLTEDGIKEKITLTEKFIVRKQKEYEELQAELELIQKGKAC